MKPSCLVRLDLQCQVAIYSALWPQLSTIKPFPSSWLEPSMVRVSPAVHVLSLLCHQMKQLLAALFFCLPDSHHSSLSSPPVSIHIPPLPSTLPLQSSLAFNLFHYQNHFTMQRQLAAPSLRPGACLSQRGVLSHECMVLIASTWHVVSLQSHKWKCFVGKCTSQNSVKGLRWVVAMPLAQLWVFFFSGYGWIIDHSSRKEWQLTDQ